MSGSGGGSRSSINLANVTSTLTGLVRVHQSSAWFLLGAFAISLLLGTLHSLIPGHGEALIAAYLVGSHWKVRDTISLGSVVTLTHTGSVLLLGLVTRVASRYILSALVIPWLEIVSGLFVIGFGVNLLVCRGRELVARVRRKPASIRGNRVYTFQQPGRRQIFPRNPYALMGGI